MGILKKIGAAGVVISAALTVPIQAAQASTPAGSLSACLRHAAVSDDAAADVDACIAAYLATLDDTADTVNSGILGTATDGGVNTAILGTADGDGAVNTGILGSASV